MVNVTWGEFEKSECVEFFKVEYAEVDDDSSGAEEAFRRGYQALEVNGDNVFEGGAGIVAFQEVPRDKMLVFRLAAGASYGDGSVWFHSPQVAYFESTDEGGCGQDRMPAFKGSLQEDLVFNKNTSTIEMDWSGMEVANDDCLSGFLLKYRMTCESCDGRKRDDWATPVVLSADSDDRRLELDIMEMFEDMSTTSRDLGKIYMRVWIRPHYNYMYEDERGGGEESYGEFEVYPRP